MALRDQPYLPLYVQDILTDEKLIECSAAAHGVYLRLLCILHKQETYGLLCLKQKYKQNTKQIINFATMLSKQMPFGANQIAECLQELVEENVITIKGDHLSQKRMLKDGELSTIRAKIGKTGGSIVTKQYGKAGFLYLMSDGYEKHKIGISVNPLNRLYRFRSDLKLPKHFNIVKQIAVNDMGKSEDKAHAFFKNIIDGEWLIGEYQDIIKKFDLLEAKFKANTEYENEYEYEYENEIDFKKKGKVQERKKDLGIQVKKPTYASLFDKVLKEENLQLPEGFYELILEWLKYKSEKGQTYKETGLKNLIIKLMNDSGGNYDAAKNMIFYSVSNNYAGLFKEKANGTRKTIAPATDIEIADILLKHFGDE